MGGSTKETVCRLTDADLLRIERSLSMASDVLDSAKWPFPLSERHQTVKALEDERTHLRALRHKIANQRVPTP